MPESSSWWGWNTDKRGTNLAVEHRVLSTGNRKTRPGQNTAVEKTKCV